MNTRVAAKRDEWWRGATMYQIYPRSFVDANGDGVGDLVGLAARLSYVADLGVDAIWLSPFFRSPMKDFGYDVSDYCEVDPLFGTLADFDRLIERAHALNLKVLIDQVWSHTSDQHPWFQASCRDPGGDKGDWYVWADPKPDGTPPNNWLSVFGGSAWCWEPRRRQYYLHHFLASQPSLNLRNEALLEALFETGRFWIERGVSGFRLDAVDFMLHDPLLRDNPPAPPADGLTPLRPFRLQEHKYDMAHAETGALVGRIRRFVDSFPGVVTLGEISSEAGAFERIERVTGGGGSRLHMAYTLGVMKGEFSTRLIREAVQSALAAERDGWLCWSFSNHDVARVATRWHPSGEATEAFAKMALALLLALRGSICLYQGEELGLPEAELSREELQDPYGITYWPEFRGRDGSRTPIPWRHDRPNGCFSSAARPWLPMQEAHKARAIDTQQSDPGSCLSVVRALLAWRRRSPALRRGDLDMLQVPEPLLAVRRRLGHDEVLAVFNTSAEPAGIALDALPPHTPVEIPGLLARRSDGRLWLPPFGVAFGHAGPA